MRACAAAGVADGPQYDDCVVDAATTADMEFVSAAARVTRPSIEGGAASVDASNTLSETFGGAVPVNVNFRYLGDELAQLVDNADAEVLVYHRSLRDRVVDARDRMPRLRHVVELDDDHGPSGYEELLRSHAPAPRIERSGDDLHASSEALGRRVDERELVGFEAAVMRNLRHNGWRRRIGTLENQRRLRRAQSASTSCSIRKRCCRLACQGCVW